MIRREKLTNGQWRFLNMCRDQTLDLPVLLERRRLLMGGLARWLRQQHFRIELAKVLNFIRFRRELDLALASLRAASALARCASPSRRCLSKDQRRACVWLVRLARQREPLFYPARDLPDPNEPHSRS